MLHVEAVLAGGVEVKLRQTVDLVVGSEGSVHMNFECSTQMFQSRALGIAVDSEGEVAVGRACMNR